MFYYINYENVWELRYTFLTVKQTGKRASLQSYIQGRQQMLYFFKKSVLKPSIMY